MIKNIGEALRIMNAQPEIITVVMKTKDGEIFEGQYTESEQFEDDWHDWTFNIKDWEKGFYAIRYGDFDALLECPIGNPV